MFRERTFLTAAVALIASVGMVACSDEDRDDLGDTADSVAEEVGEAADSVAEEVGEAAESAVSAVGDAAEEAGQDAAELAARNIAAQQGEEQFADAGHPLDDAGLSCEATVEDGVDGVAIDCTGITADGAAAALTGTTSEVPGASATNLEGDFAGTVDGDEVFSTPTLGG